MSDLTELQSLLVASIAEAEGHCGRASEDKADLQEQFWAGVSLGQRQVLEFIQTGHWAPRSE